MRKQHLLKPIILLALSLSLAGCSAEKSAPTTAPAETTTEAETEATTEAVEEEKEFIPPYTTADFKDYANLGETNLFKIRDTDIVEFPIKLNEFLRRADAILADKHIALGEIEPGGFFVGYIDTKGDQWKECGYEHPGMRVTIKNFSDEPIEISQGWITEISDTTGFLRVLESGKDSSSDKLNLEGEKYGFKSSYSSDKLAYVYAYDRAGNKFELSTIPYSDNIFVKITSIEYLKNGGQYDDEVAKQEERFATIQNQKEEAEKLYNEATEVVTAKQEILDARKNLLNEQSKNDGTRELNADFKNAFIEQVKSDIELGLVNQPVRIQCEINGESYVFKNNYSQNLCKITKLGDDYHIYYTDWTKSIEALDNGESYSEVDLSADLLSYKEKFAIGEKVFNAAFYNELSDDIDASTLSVKYEADESNKTNNKHIIIHALVNWKYKDGRDFSADLSCRMDASESCGVYDTGKLSYTVDGKTEDFNFDSNMHTISEKYHDLYIEYVNQSEIEAEDSLEFIKVKMENYFNELNTPIKAVREAFGVDNYNYYMKSDLIVNSILLEYDLVRKARETK